MGLGAGVRGLGAGARGAVAGARGAAATEETRCTGARVCVSTASRPKCRCQSARLRSSSTGWHVGKRWQVHGRSSTCQRVYLERIRFEQMKRRNRLNQNTEIKTEMANSRQHSLPAFATSTARAPTSARHSPRRQRGSVDDLPAGLGASLILGKQAQLGLLAATAGGLDRRAKVALGAASAAGL